MAQRPPSAQRVAQQAKVNDKNSLDAKVEAITGERGSYARVVQDDNTLALILPRAGEPDRHDLSFLLRVPNLMPMLAEGIRRYGEEYTERSTLMLRIAELKRYFVRYASQYGGTSLRPTDLCDDGFWWGFIGFLNEPGVSGEPLAHATRSCAIGSVRRILAALSAAPEWHSHAHHILEYVPKNPWPGHDRKVNPVPVIPLDQFDSIILAAVREFALLRDHWAERERLLVEGRERFEAGYRDYQDDKALCLAVLEERYKGLIPPLEVLYSHDHQLGRAVQHFHTISHIRSYFYASARDLVPLVLLIAGRTLFNPDLVLGLEWSDLDYIEGPNARQSVRFSSYKARANRTQTKYLESEPDEPYGLHAMLQLIETMTDRLRSLVPREHRHRLFIFAPRSGNPEKPKGWTSHNDSGSAAKAWRSNLANFIQDNGLEPFTLSQFRPTRGSELFLATGDIVTSRDELGHSSSLTTYTYYTSDAVDSRDKERIGQVLMLGERWRATDGKIDPRGNQHDPGAATPGFLCMNPHDSPRRGQRKGRLCQAYGECADCPMAGAINDVPAAAQYLAVRDAIVAGQQNMAPQTWHQKWASILAAHDAMLATLDGDVLERAKKLKLTYPPVA